MDIRLESYKVFYTAAECGSFSEAAKKLYITQSAVSQQIKALENELGALLFVRGRKGAKLTSYGELLFEYVNGALERIESAESLFSRMKTLDEGSVRIGAGDTLTRHFLIDIIKAFHEKYPRIKIEVINRVTGETLSMLASGAVDIALVNLPVEEAALKNAEVIPVGSMHEVFVAGKAFSNLKGKILSMEELASLPLVMLEPKSNTRAVTDAYFAANGVVLKPEFELGSHDLLFDFAKSGLGVACVTEEFAGELIDGENLFRLETDFSLPAREIGVCRMKNVAPTLAVRRLTGMIFGDK
ncbi:MAG: LysR family transcriptional regulator [Clostridia bacterium]|nr:LysR family transcriptional regulator [Clostridia bacterium]